MPNISVKLVLGVLGNVTSVALFLSPLPTFWNIYKLRSTQNFSAMPYVCTLFTCSFWLLYGMPCVKPNSILLLTTNGIGFLLELFYFSLYIAFASKQKKLKAIRLTMVMCVALVGVLVITLVALHTHSARQLLAGTACIVLSVAMYASPLSVMGVVISTKNVECMPFLISLFNLINALVWTAYSIFTHDIFIAIPNGCGSLLGIVQLTLYAVYRTSPTTRKIDLCENKYNEEMNSNESVDNVQIEMQDETAIPTKIATSPRFSMSIQRVSPQPTANAES